MKDTKHKPRVHRRGVILLSTLIMLVLMMSLAVLTQSLAVSNIKTISRLNRAEQQDLFEDSLRELARPLVAEAMLDFREPHSLKLDGSDYGVTLQSRDAIISVQNIEGLVSISKSPDDDIRTYLPEDLTEIVIRMRQDIRINQPLRQRFILAGGDIQKYPDIENWITNHSEYSRFDSDYVPDHYDVGLFVSPRPGSGQQPRVVTISVR